MYRSATLLLYNGKVAIIQGWAKVDSCFYYQQLLRYTQYSNSLVYGKIHRIALDGSPRMCAQGFWRNIRLTHPLSCPSVN